jgi:molybdate transport system regulatory protein
MKISARNVFKGSVTHLQIGAVNDEVSVAIGGGNKVTAIVTHSSAQSLGLAVGKEVMVIIKASSVLVMVDDTDVRLSARNCLSGTVTNVTDGAVESEVTIGLSGGAAVHAVITRGAVEEFGIKNGMPAKAVIKASSVILGVAG